MLSAGCVLLDSLIDNLNPTLLDILEHILECRKEECSIHLSEAMGKEQPHVHRSLKESVEKQYVLGESGKGTQANNLLMRKGLGAAFLLRNDYDLLMSYSKLHFPRDYKEHVAVTYYIDVLGKRPFYVPKYFEYAFQRDMLIRQLTSNEINLFRKWIALQSMVEFDGIDSLKDIMNTYGITKRAIRESVEDTKKKIRIVEKQLRDL